MKQITSFTINHDYLKPGMYISRVDGDVITYDLRMKLPNTPAGDYLEDNALHTFEHLFATYVRNTPLSDGVVYRTWAAAPASISSPAIPFPVPMLFGWCRKLYSMY
ncbi:MAG: S-ribosylhomocysteine lyase [Ruminococcus callidus]